MIESLKTDPYLNSYRVSGESSDDGQGSLYVTANLTTYFGDGHGMVGLDCQSCGPGGKPVHRTYSFYPERLQGKGILITNAKSVFVIAGVAIHQDPNELSRYCPLENRLIPPSKKRYSITEQQARRVYEFVSTPHRYHFLGVLGYNCVDFTQKAYEEADLKGHFIQGLNIGGHVFPEFWGTVPPAHMAIYNLMHPYHPETLITLSLIALVAIRVLRKLF